MTWSFVLNDVSQDIPEHMIMEQGLENDKYPDDIRKALSLARSLGLKSGAITGMRMSNPYNDDEVVDVSVRGRMLSNDFVSSVRDDIKAGPDSSHSHLWAPHGGGENDGGWMWYQCDCGAIQPGSRRWIGG